MKSMLSAGLVTLSLVFSVAAQEPAETKEQRDERMKWFREAKFGMFIHWGLYAVPAGTYDGKIVRGYGEWIMNKGKIPVDLTVALPAEAPDKIASVLCVETE